MEQVSIDINLGSASQKVATELMIAYRASNVIRNLVRSGNIPDENNVFQKFRHKPDVWDMRQALKSRAVNVASD